MSNTCKSQTHRPSGSGLWFAGFLQPAAQENTAVEFNSSGAFLREAYAGAEAPGS
jgi:hypothetical protein